MTLSTEMILTLQQLDGIGNKTILKIANQAPTSIGDFGQLCDFWKSLKGKKFESFSKRDFEYAYHPDFLHLNFLFVEFLPKVPLSVSAEYGYHALY